CAVTHVPPYVSLWMNSTAPGCRSTALPRWYRCRLPWNHWSITIVVSPENTPTGMTTAVPWSVSDACSCALALTVLGRIGRDRSITGLVLAKNTLCVYGSLSRLPGIGPHVLNE